MKYPQLVSMPSAVSDWLEEQLEARGIDSEVYTRYILSLLHAHTLDVIYPDDDLPFLGLKKERGRSVVAHKRLRRTGTWWRHAHADAEQIKRSAAVECLMSATEQSCEIESLVDELCEKLKEVNSTGNNFPNKSNQDTKIFKESLKQRKISPKELAEQYYAAFPPLNQREENSYSTNINLVTGKWPSPKKNHIDLIAAKWTSGSPKKTKRKAKRQLHEATTKPTFRMAQNRNRFGHKRTHSGRNLTKEISDNISNWEFVYNNNNYQIMDQCLDYLDPTVEMAYSEDVDMCDIDENDSPICRMKVWLKNAESEKDYITSKTNNTVKRTRLYEKNVKYIPLYPTAIWSDNKGPPNDKWGIAKRSPEKPPPEGDIRASWLTEEEEETAIREEYQRWAKEKEVECAIKKEYDRPHELYCHERTQRVASISSYWDMNFNKTAVQVGKTNPSNVTILNPRQRESEVLSMHLQTQDDEFTAQNRTNNLLEDLNRQRVVTAVICKGCEYSDCWWNREVSKIPLFMDFNAVFDDKTISLMKVNHSLDNSAFREYSRPVLLNIDDLCPRTFIRQFSRSSKRPRTVTDNSSPLKLPITLPGRMSEEQKRTSPHMYFEPIKTSTLGEEPKEKDTVLKDGTTFNIRGSPNEVKFQRTATGSLLLETEFGELRKYFEYNWRPPSDESVKLPHLRKLPEYEGFKIKYWVSPNDKACQTVEVLPPVSTGDDEMSTSTSGIRPVNSTRENEGDNKEPLEEDNFFKLAPSQAVTSKEAIKLDSPEGLDNSSETDEMVWGYAPKSSDLFCKYCNVKHSWPNSSLKSLGNIDWDERTVKNIWEGTETCVTCPWSTKVPTPLAETTTKLREESKEEAERLLSDLSSLQLSYSARLLEAPFKTNEGPSEKRRRHSYINSDADLWSFTTRLEEDCLISLSTLPTRRSVTL